MTEEEAHSIIIAWRQAHGGEAHTTGWSLGWWTESGRIAIVVISRSAVSYKRDRARAVLRRMIAEGHPSALAARDVLLEHNPDELHRVMWEG